MGTGFSSQTAAGILASFATSWVGAVGDENEPMQEILWEQVEPTLRQRLVEMFEEETGNAAGPTPLLDSSFVAFLGQVFRLAEFHSPRMTLGADATTGWSFAIGVVDWRLAVWVAPTMRFTAE